MIEILSSDNYDRDSIALKEQICWAVGNIAGMTVMVKIVDAICSCFTYREVRFDLR